MSHKIGNSPKCIDCKFYREKYDCETCNGDGWCKDGLWHGKVKIKDVYSVKWNDSCNKWVDKETGLTSYEVQTRTPEPIRTPEDIEYLSRYIEWRQKNGSERKKRNS